MADSKNNNEMDMDQFMNDFLDGKYLDDNETPKAAHRASARRGVRRTKSSETPRPPAARSDLIENNSSSEGTPTRHGTRRTSKSSGEGEGHDHHHHRRRPQRRSTKDKDQLDPQMVLRMLEMYADNNDNEKADAMLHYNSTKNPDRDETAGNPNKADPSVKMTKNNAAPIAA